MAVIGICILFVNFGTSKCQCCPGQTQCALGVWGSTCFHWGCSVPGQNECPNCFVTYYNTPNYSVNDLFRPSPPICHTVGVAPWEDYMPTQIFVHLTYGVHYLYLMYSYNIIWSFKSSGNISTSCIKHRSMVVCLINLNKNGG
jgi:hypothetical protein